MSMTVDRFLQGMTPQEHIANMKINRERFSQVLANVEIPADDREYFASLPSSLHVAVITEDWCGDHITTTPVLYKLAEDAGKLDVRVFMRDQNWDLADAFLPKHRRDTVPVFVFFTSEDMREISLFIETAPDLVPSIDGMEDAIREAHPEVPDIGNDVNEMSDSTRNLLRQERGSFRVNHAREWGRVISRDFREVVAAGLARSPGEGPAEGGTEWPPPDS
jgi:thiol-disulfide isomerase/thioredoxin